MSEVLNQEVQDQSDGHFLQRGHACAKSRCRAPKARDSMSQHRLHDVSGRPQPDAVRVQARHVEIPRVHRPHLARHRQPARQHRGQLRHAESQRHVSAAHRPHGALRMPRRRRLDGHDGGRGEAAHVRVRAPHTREQATAQHRRNGVHLNTAFGSFGIDFFFFVELFVFLIRF